MEMENNKVVKKPIFGSLIAALCIMIYLGALVYASLMIYLSIEDRKKTAEQEFNNIARVAQIEGTASFLDDRFFQIMHDTLHSLTTIEAIIITYAEGAYEIEKKKGHAVTITNNSPRFKKKFIFSNESYYTSLTIPGERNANIQAVASAFNFSEFSKILKVTLLMILIGFALSFFTMLFKLLMGKQDNKEQVVYTNANTNASAPAPLQTESNVRIAESGGPKGLYSTRSNIGWEEYTNDRLDSEIHRCSSTEKDIVLILMEFTSLSGDIMYVQAAEEAVKFFTSRDLLFEYGKQGITVILPSISLDVGITKSEKFYQKINEKFSQSGDCGLCIGLSSRSGRLLNADRLMMESKEALKKAKSDSRTSIVAFKSDPEKYRAFIASQS